MKPSQGDTVRLTDNFLLSNPSWNSLRGADLFVWKLKLRFAPFKLYTIIFKVANSNALHQLNVDDSGYYVDDFDNVQNYMVFGTIHTSQQGFCFDPPEDSDEEDFEDKAEAGFTPSRHATVDEANSICVICGSPAVDLVFSNKCTNPNCKNYG